MTLAMWQVILSIMGAICFGAVITTAILLVSKTLQHDELIATNKILSELILKLKEHVNPLEVVSNLSKSIASVEQLSANVRERLAKIEATVEQHRKQDVAWALRFTELEVAVWSEQLKQPLVTREDLDDAAAAPILPFDSFDEARAERKSLWQDRLRRKGEKDGKQTK